MVIRDEHGELITALAEKISIPESILTLETLEPRRVVQFVQELGLRNSIFEGDSKTSINIISKGSYYIHHMVLLLKTCYCLLALFKTFISLTFVGKVML